MPKIIVLMSTYNGEKYLSEQIESILNQSERDIRLDIHDDGSTDNTINIIKRYVKLDGRVRFLGSEHKGYPNCFFDMVSKVDEARFYAFSDQDDVWYTNKLEKAINSLNDELPMLYACDKEIVDSDLYSLNWEKTYPPKNLEDAMMKYNNISGCTMVFNKSLYLIFKSYIPHSAPYHDAYFLRLAFLFGKFVFDEKKYIKYRQHQNNTIGVEHTGIRLLISKLKNFDYTLKKYKNTNVKLYAQELYNGYRDVLPLAGKSLILNIINISEYKSRVELLKSNITFEPLSIYIVIKFRVLLGML